MGRTGPIDLAGLFGVPPGTRYVYLRCPAHGDEGRPNLAVYPDGTYCYACGFKETPEAFLARVAEHPEQAVVPAGGATGRPPPVVDWGAQARLYARNLLEGARRGRLVWLWERGLTEETVRRAGLGHDGRRFVIPYRDGDRVIGLKFRRDPAYGDDGPRYQNSPGLSGVYRPCPGGYPTVVTEGELDALLLAQYGVDGVTVATGVRGLARLRLPPRGVIVACDWDRAGEEVARELVSRHPGWIRMPRPEQGKDLGEWLSGLPRPERGLRLRDRLVDLALRR